MGRRTTEPSGGIDGGQLQEENLPCPELLSAARRCSPRSSRAQTPYSSPTPGSQTATPAARALAGCPWNQADFAGSGHLTPTATRRGRTTLASCLAFCRLAPLGAQPSGSRSPVTSALGPRPWRGGSSLSPFVLRVEGGFYVLMLFKRMYQSVLSISLFFFFPGNF